MCVDLSRSLWNECISQTGILYFRLRFTRVLPSTYSLHILPHTLSFFLCQSGPKSPTCSSSSLLYHSHRMESRVISAVSFPQPHKLQPLDRKGSICAFMLSVFDFFGLCPLSLSLSPGFSHCLMIVSSSVNKLPDRPHPLMACSLHRMLGEND